MLLNKYSIYRLDRKSENGTNAQGVVFVAVMNSIVSEKLDLEKPDCNMTYKVN